MYLERHEPDPTKHGLAVAVRQLCSVHHKFAVLTGSTPQCRVRCLHRMRCRRLSLQPWSCHRSQRSQAAMRQA